MTDDAPYVEEPVTLANLSFDQNALPTAPAFGDIFFSKHDGIGETNTTFVDPVMAHLQSTGSNGEHEHSTILELGFGSGLNFAASLHAWHRVAHPTATLHYVAVDAHPWLRQQRAAALARFHPQLGDALTALLRAELPAAPGAFRVPVPRPGTGTGAGPDVSLTLVHADALSALSVLRLPRGFDAAYLDGFAPARNPGMWSAPALQALSALASRARPSMLATFTAASGVRKALQAAGWTVRREPGHGAKRHRMLATRTDAQSPYAAAAGSGGARGGADIPPEAPSPAAMPTETSGPPRSRAERRRARDAAWQVGSRAAGDVLGRGSRVAVVGLGVAGACVAEAAARRGMVVTVFDADPALCAGASAIAAGIVSPRLRTGADVQAQVGAAALEFFRSTLHRLDLAGPDAGVWRSGVVFSPQADPRKDLTWAEAVAASYPLRPGSVELLSPAAACSVLLRAAPTPPDSAGWAQEDARGRHLLGDAPLLWSRRAGVVDATAFREALWAAAAARGASRVCAAVHRVTATEDSAHLVTAPDTEAGRTEWGPFDGVFLSTGAGAASVELLCPGGGSPFPFSAAFPGIKASRGQAFVLPAPSARMGSPPLAATIAGAYCAAVPSGASVVVGAANRPVPVAEGEPPADADDPEWAAREIARRLPRDLLNAHGVSSSPETWVREGRHVRATRVAAPDALPLVGPVPRPDGFAAAMPALGGDHTAPGRAGDAFVPRVHAAVGMGSRGFLFSPLMAELAVAMASGDPWPLTQPGAGAVHAARLLARAAMRGRL